MGFVGLGNMGFPMANRLTRAGSALTVFAIDRSAGERFAAENKAAAARMSLGKGMDHTAVVRWFQQLAQIRMREEKCGKDA